MCGAVLVKYIKVYMTQAIATVYCAELEGITARPITVEVDMHIGLASFTIVGLGDKAVSEARERVSSAIKNSGAKPPTRENRKVTVNLAPADIKKNGSQYDVAIALGYLAASGQIKSLQGRKAVFVGELGLHGDVRPIAGALAICLCAREMGVEEIYIPQGNKKEVACLTSPKIIPVENLKELLEHLDGIKIIPPVTPQEFVSEQMHSLVDMSEIKGQESAKRALTIAAAGGHNILFSGPPGAGKTMLAQSLVSILPDITFSEALEVTQIYSAAGLLLDKPFIAYRPFRAPHHSASLVSLVGGGATPRPGEISLAHRGVLFLDEIPEFHRDALEALRQPLENGTIVVSRSRNSIVFPSKFILVAAANPCPCGYWRDTEKECVCSAGDIAKYQKKLSGPLLDRIDMHMWVGRITSEQLRGPCDAMMIRTVRENIMHARMQQRNRFIETNQRHYYANADMSSHYITENIKIHPTAQKTLDILLDKAKVSTRVYFKIIKIARTIADLDEKDIIDEECVTEAFSYRPKEIKV